MFPPSNKSGKKNLPLIIMAAILTLLQGCNGDNYSTDELRISKSITEIRVNENDDSWYCTVNGNYPLTFSAINDLSPTGVLLYFPDTTLNLLNTDYKLPENEIIGMIEADEFKDGNSTNARILIGLHTDRPYSISSNENELNISFPKTLTRPNSFASGPKPDQEYEGGQVNTASPPASELKKVTATPLENHIVVNLDADGTISNYKSFTIDNPARIVFDIFGVGSQHTEGQAISVESKWVRRIRYRRYPDKIRLVLDTESQFLTDFFSFPTGSGLLIYVGQLPEPLGKTGKIIPPVK
jgi:type IV pilus assembly protein PilQ